MITDPFRNAAGVVRFVWDHPANRDYRVRSLARAVKFQARGRIGKRTLADIGERSHMWAELRRSASSAVVYANPPDWNEMQAWRRLLRPGDLFVDVGSNVGAYALWAAELGAQVIALEPDPETAVRLRENVGLNPESEVDVRQNAVAAETGTMTMTVGLDTRNRLRPGTVDGEQVDVVTLDEVLQGAVATVKVDVEGAERLVLQGAERSLAAGNIRVLQLEWNSTSVRLVGEDRAPVAALLRKHGYQLCRPDRQGLLHPVTSTDYGRDMFAVAPTDLPGRAK